MKSFTIIIMSITFLLGCSSDPKGLKVIERYDKTLSLVRDNHDKLYFQSAVGEECGGEFWFSNSATFDNGKNNVNYELEEKALEEVIDLNTFKFDQISDNYQNYYFQDKSNTYTVFLTMCENTVVYLKK